MVTKRARTIEGSCWACKDRRVACDLRRPKCTKCELTQRDCEYGKTRLRWVNGAASRGRLAGQGLTGPNSLVPTSLSPGMTAERMMRYFEHVVIARFNLSTKPLFVDLESMSQDVAVQSAMIALANSHFSLYGRTDPATALVAKRQSRQAAITNFRNELGEHNLAKINPQNLFMVSVLLCVLDGIIEPSEETTATYFHLQGGKAILGQWDDLCEDALSRKGLPALSLSVFVTMDLIHAILGGEKSYFDHTCWIRFANNDCWWGSLPADDPFLELMSIFTRLAQLGQQVRKYSKHVPVSNLLPLQRILDSTAELIKSNLHKSDQYSSDKDAGYRRSWAAFCSAYRLSALIYMYRALGNLDVDHPMVQRVTEEGVRTICDTPFTGKLSHCLLFPTLVIGCHCVHESQRSAIRSGLKNTASFLSFGGIQLMESFMEDLWSKTAANWDWWTTFEPLSKTTFLF